MKFSKMNGIGNDYIYINLIEEKISDPSYLAKKLSDRHFGIGADGIILIDKSQSADFSMRMFNPDGSEGEMCGNAIRCVGKYVYEKGLTKKKNISISTLAGTKYLTLFIDYGKVNKVKVNMGKANCHRENLHLNYEEEYLINKPINTSRGKIYASCVSMGNPHTVIFIADEKEIDMELGKEISNNKIFLQRTNVEFVKVIDRENLFVRVYERGTGETMACGTGACASYYIAFLLGKVNKKVTVHLKGGLLFVEMNNNEIEMTGNAEFNYEGEINL